MYISEILEMRGFLTVKKYLLLIEIIFCLSLFMIKLNTIPITYVCAKDNFNHNNVSSDTENVRLMV